MDYNKEKAQGAIEYLLLLGAAIVIVGIVIMAMVNTVRPAQDTAGVETYRYLCESLENGGLNSNTYECGCYLGNSSKGDANSTRCCAESNTLLHHSTWNCPTS